VGRLLLLLAVLLLVVLLALERPAADEACKSR
jgi:hypothetical protein